MVKDKEQNILTNCSQNYFIKMATLASAFSMTTYPIQAGNNHILDSVVIEQTYDYFTTSVQETRYVTPGKKNFREHYAHMVKSKWFKRAYDNKSVGDVIDVDY